MRRSTKRKLNNLGLVAMIIGAVVIGAFGLKLILDTSPDVPKASETLEAPGIDDETSTPTPVAQPTATSTALSDGQHEVKISVESDGGIRVGFRFTGGDEGVKDATKTFSRTANVSGSTGLAQVGVQLLDNASFATCTITVDGQKKSTQKTNNQASVAVCGI